MHVSINHAFTYHSELFYLCVCIFAALYFALLSRNSLTMLKLYLDYEHIRIIEKFDDRTIFLKAYYQNKHWIDVIFNHEKTNNILSTRLSSTLYQNLQVCRTALNSTSLPFDENLSKLSLESIDSSVIHNDVIKLCFLEISRQFHISKFINSHSNSIDFTKSHLMTQLLKIPIYFTMEKYESILNVLKLNYEYNEAQLKIFSSNLDLSSSKTELQLLNEYMIVKIYLVNILQERDTLDSDASVKNIRSLLKTINDGNVIFKLMQTVMLLAFTRFDHIRRARIRHRTNEQTSNSSTSNQNNSYSTDISDSALIDSYNNSGFICSRKSLEVILNSVRLFLMSLDITEAYKNSDNSLKKKFSQLLHEVDHFLWKLSIIDSNEQPIETKKKIQFYSSREWLFIHDDSRLVVIQEKTSDDEKCATRRKPLRKKMRKRSRISTKSDDHDEDSENGDIPDNSGATENSENRVKLSDINKRPESVISKMLMNPESMIALCIQKNDYDSVRKILKVFFHLNFFFH